MFSPFVQTDTYKDIRKCKEQIRPPRVMPPASDLRGFRSQEIESQNSMAAPTQNNETNGQSGRFPTMGKHP